MDFYIIGLKNEKIIALSAIVRCFDDLTFSAERPVEEVSGRWVMDATA